MKPTHPGIPNSPEEPADANEAYRIRHTYPESELTTEERLWKYGNLAEKQDQDERYLRDADPRRNPTRKAFMDYLFAVMREGEGNEVVPFGDGAIDPGGSGLYSLRAYEEWEKGATPEEVEAANSEGELQKNTPEDEQDRFIDAAFYFAEEMADFLSYANPKPNEPSYYLERIGAYITSLARINARNEGANQERRYQEWSKSLHELHDQGGE